MPEIIPVKRAIISVTDKQFLDVLAGGLKAYESQIHILSSGGTAKKLEELGYNAEKIEDYTGFPESPGGFLKTIHPFIAGGILLSEYVTEQYEYMIRNKIKPVHIVAVNFYPLRKMIEEGKSIEEIRVHGTDIGGPNMVRAAAKSFPTALVLVDPNDYTEAIGEINRAGGTTFDLRYEKMQKAWKVVFEYDAELKEYWCSLPKEVARKFYFGK
jgi:phosphoribosylaminoimidazolecarboxamide formyltransferase/IMP cyclohydrolase